MELRRPLIHYVVNLYRSGLSSSSGSFLRRPDLSHHFLSFPWSQSSSLVRPSTLFPPLPYHHHHLLASRPYANLSSEKVRENANADPKLKDQILYQIPKLRKSVGETKKQLKELVDLAKIKIENDNKLKKRQEFSQNISSAAETFGWLVTVLLAAWGVAISARKYWEN